MILGDYHTHTFRSDGHDDVMDIAAAAEAAGLKEVGISDHGLRHVARGLKFREIEEERRLVEEANKRFNVRCLLSIEANIYTSNGKIDLKPQHYDLFDYIVAGFHKAPWAANPWQYLTYNLPGYFVDLFPYTNGERRHFTKAIVGAIKHSRINILSHLNYGVPTFVKEVGKAAIDYNTYIELNGKKVSMTDDEVATLDAMGVQFILNSDAHTADRVGDVSVPLSVVERVGIDKSHIVNWDKLPDGLKVKK
jgi:putative hydrolase